MLPGRSKVKKLLHKDTNDLMIPYNRTTHNSAIIRMGPVSKTSLFAKVQKKICIWFDSSKKTYISWLAD